MYDMWLFLRNKKLEGELREVNGLYTKVKREKNQLQRILEEKMRELRKREVIIKNRDQTIKELQNQIQQYSKDFKEEHVLWEKLTLQFNKMQEILKEKEEKLYSVKNKLAKDAVASCLKAGPEVYVCNLMYLNQE